MGLTQSDPKPHNLTLSQAYERILTWYSQNIPLLRERMGGQEYGKKSEALILALPPADQLSELEIRAVLGEVIYGHLEWAYHQADSQYKMAAYAHGALEAAGLSGSLTEQDRKQLVGSRLWPYLMINR